MALYHLSMKPISRASGRSSVASAAYRAAERLENERDGIVHDFSRRSGVEHAEIVIPAGADAEWAKKRSALWNAAEASEKRKDARVAREIEVSLPHELSGEQRLALTREFAQGLADRYGVAVDFAIHSPHGKTDIRNHHAHIMMTTRKAGPDGLGEKSDLELENKKLQALGLPTSHEQLRDIRIGWEQRTNEHLARAGLDIRVDHRSHQERGLEIEPTQHMGVHATQMERRGKDVSRVRLDEEAAKRNAALIREKRTRC
jgi:ATP-dependent exoDNAse (exonuclease V) alpha subunit